MAKKKTKKAPPRKTAKAKPVKAVKGPVDKDALRAMFHEAASLAAEGFLFDAIKRFKDVAAASPKGDLADDSIYNAGLCCFQLNLFEDAISYFSSVVQGYPKATIHAALGAKEFGRTAAKAHLGRLRCSLALGRREDAQKELDSLNEYPESYVVDADGRKKTYYELGLEALK